MIQESASQRASRLHFVSCGAGRAGAVGGTGPVRAAAGMGRARTFQLLVGITVLLAVAACAPVLPDRSKPGGAARWAQALSIETAVLWAPDALLCRVTGIGIGNEGWLPDRGGSWVLTYRSATRGKALDVSVDTDGRVTTGAVPDSIAARLHVLPADWDDSPRAWAATSAHQKGMPLNTFESLLCQDAEPDLYPGQVVWRIRFFLQGGGYETHVVSAKSKWLTRIDSTEPHP